jgi:hypothetical protein
MAELFTLPARATDSNGDNLSGAKLYFYATGTTTPQNVYSDADLNTSLGAVVTADSGGKFVGIYLDPLLTYRAVLKTSDDVTTIYDLDPIGSGANAADIQFTAEGTGAVVRTVGSKLGDTVSVKDFGAVGDGVTDDTAEFQAAIDSLGAAGGSVIVPDGMRCLIDSNLTVKANVSLVGPHQYVGSPDDNTNAPYGSVGGALLVNSAATITLKGGASLTGLLIHRKGMTFPAANSSAYAGTAVTIGGDDATVRNCMLLGFATAITSTDWQRGRFFDLLMDNTNGISISNAYDIPRIENVHCWPFATIAQYAIDLLPTQLQRSGTAFELNGVADWAKLTNCFAYGYFRGFDLNNVNTATLISCTVDGTAPPNVLAGCRGFSVRGTSYDTKLIGCQAASQEIGFYLDTGADIQNQLTNCVGWNGTNHAFFIGAGDWLMTSCVARQFTNGILYNNAASRLTIRGFQFGSTLTTRLNCNVAATTGFISFDGAQAPSAASGASLVTGTFTGVSVASASPLPIPAVGSDFNITGTTNFSNLQSGWAGREVTLYFAGILTVVHGTGAADAIRLSGAANFTTTAGATLTLRHNGTQWYEVGRSA